MAEVEESATPAESEPLHPYTETALARLRLSEAYREAAEAAIAGVCTADDGGHFAGGGSFIEDADRMVRLAEEIKRKAVIYERQLGTSWEEVGRALAITKQSAHKKFASEVEAWRAPLDKPARVRPDGTPDDDRIPYGVRYAEGIPRPEYGTAEETARDLDRWLREHTSRADSWSDEERAASAGLPRHSTTSMLMLLGAVSRRLLEEQLVPDPRAEADLAERRVALYERLIREGGVVPPEIHQWIEKDRARAAALRATPGTGTPWPIPGDAPKEAL
ncbi:hypothetical protein [Streptomyces sp. RLB3-6]|uniref:hypothetical protein n=1 Tax=Streptomyces sp. RLB3-6 TaxID=2594457 RepID=UPI001165979E|nr:hypothetical protein [Streptomyces sp. RLB3-6]QDN84396.1 hypothetical protein FNV61_00280 [Streptomyces sp. RLB3-6]